MALLAGWLVSTAVPYYSFETDINFLMVKQDMIDNNLWLANFYVHISGGIVAILVGCLLFWRRLINEHSKLHKQLGKAYVIAILLVAAPTGLFLSFYSEGGIWTVVGFIFMSLIWMITTTKAYTTIRKGDVQGHKEWMIRSYAVTFSGVTLRVMVPLCSYYFGMTHLSTLIFTSYACWMLNLIVAEGIILYQQRRTTLNTAQT